jgi:large subunit ribosomal protein L21e
MAQIQKNVRQRGKIQLSEYFKDLKVGDTVAVVNEASIPSSFPQRIIGRTGKVVGARGRSKVVDMLDGNMPKQFIIHPIHLKKLK